MGLVLVGPLGHCLRLQVVLLSHLHVLLRRLYSVIYLLLVTPNSVQLFRVHLLVLQLLVLLKLLPVPVKAVVRTDEHRRLSLRHERLESVLKRRSRTKPCTRPRFHLIRFRPKRLLELLSLSLQLWQKLLGSQDRLLVWLHAAAHQRVSLIVHRRHSCSYPIVELPERREPLILWVQVIHQELRFLPTQDIQLLDAPFQIVVRNVAVSVFVKLIEYLVGLFALIENCVLDLHQNLAQLLPLLNWKASQS